MAWTSHRSEFPHKRYGERFQSSIPTRTVHGKRTAVAIGSLVYQSIGRRKEHSRRIPRNSTQKAGRAKEHRPGEHKKKLREGEGTQESEQTRERPVRRRQSDVEEGAGTRFVDTEIPASSIVHKGYAEHVIALDPNGEEQDTTASEEVEQGEEFESYSEEEGQIVVASQPLESRYPQRVRRPPERFEDYVCWDTNPGDSESGDDS